MIDLLGMLFIWGLSVALALGGVIVWVSDSPWWALLLMACSFGVMIGGLYLLAETAMNREERP